MVALCEIRSTNVTKEIGFVFSLSSSIQRMKTYSIRFDENMNMLNRLFFFSIDERKKNTRRFGVFFLLFFFDALE